MLVTNPQVGSIEKVRNEEERAKEGLDYRRRGSMRFQEVPYKVNIHRYAHTNVNIQAG